MTFGYKKALILGVLLCFSGLSASADEKARKCNSVECACEKALERNTAEALEQFLKKYQHDARTNGTACAAVAARPKDEGFDNRNAKYQLSHDPGEASSIE